MKPKPPLLRFSWRVLVPVTLLLAAGLVWLLWTPGLELRDGRHDRSSNAVWLAHGWLGADSWFTRYCEWETDASEWAFFRSHFLHP